MPDHFTETTTVGYGKRILNSIGGIFFGFVLFIASFGVLYTNEGKVDFSNIAKTAVQVDSGVVTTDAALTDKLLSVTGNIDTTETIGDDMYLKPGKYLALTRNVEMYAWQEKTTTRTQKNLGGSETHTTDYDYAKEWTSNPENSSHFKYPEEHQNPELTIKETSKRVNKGTVGAYEIDMPNVTLPGLSPLILNAENTEIKDGTTLENSSIFIGKSTGSTLTNPQIGDIKISYSTLNPGINVTVFGKLTGKLLGTYLDKNNNKLFQIFAGTKEEAVSDLHSQYEMWIWIWRGIGFLMMLFGLQMIVAPISVLADVLPFLGSISRGLVGIVAFIVALVLSVTTILISMLFHNIIALAIAAILIIGGAVLFIRNKKGQKNATPVSPQPPNTAPPATK
jgi:hypothetical protein